MIRHAGRAMALFAVGALFASGAWAQADRPVTLTQSVTDPYFVAAELLGSPDGTVVQLGSAGGTGTAPRPAIRLTLTNGNDHNDNGTPADLTDDTNTPIPAVVVSENTAEITFNMTGAVFAQNVGAGTLDLRQDSGTGDGAVASLSTEVISGGAVGDSSVTFLVEATANITSGQRISFWVPDLRVSPTTIGAMGTPPMPVTGVAITASLVEKRAVKGTDAGQVPFPMVVGGVDTPMIGAVAAVNNVANRWVVGLGQVVGISMGDSDLNVATVALNARTVFATSNANYTPMGSTTSMKALGLGTLTVAISRMVGTNTIYTLDPGDPAVEGTGEDAELDNSLAGNVDVMIKGAFKSGDKVLYGAARTAAKIADGMAAVSVPITAAGSSTEFIYVPGGVDALRPGAITAVAMRNFSRSGNHPGKAAMSMGMIEYAGVSVQAYAHGVVRGGGTDSSYVRVRCASSTDCTVFADCHDQAGMNYFEEAGTIDAGATSVVSSDMIAAVLGGGWSSGRGACDLMSNGDLEVQHMVRSGHTLVNNSAVVGRSLSLNEKQLMSIEKALDDICSSLPGHLGREGDADGPDNDLATTNDNISMVAATMCNNALAGGAVVADDVDANGADVPGF